MVRAVGQVTNLLVIASEAKRLGNFPLLDRLKPHLQSVESEFAAGLQKKKGLPAEQAQERSSAFFTRFINHLVYKNNGDARKQAETAATYYLRTVV